MNNYIVATIHPWNIEQYQEYSQELPGNWHLITEKKQLTLEYVEAVQPTYIFFPHWSWLVPNDIYTKFPCVCFHMTDLPYGRGGSPLQNLILRGHTTTKLTALIMNKTLDGGPILLKEDLDLLGSAEQIFKKLSKQISSAIKKIIISNPSPKEQEGKVTIFTRRTAEESQIPEGLTAQELYNFIRMLDAPGYPKAFIEQNNQRIEFSNAQIDNGSVFAQACFSQTNKE